MSNILKEQESLDSVYKERTQNGIILIIIGFVLLPVFGIGIYFLIKGARSLKEGSNFKTGAKGEKRVSKTLSEFSDDWYIFNDMIIGSSQIDHIIISPIGVYTIETKNHKGRIYGNSDHKEWSQVINPNYTKPFYNPVMQGNRHSYEFSKYLAKGGFNNIWVNTIVVFSRKNVQLKVYSPKVPVIYADELKEHLNHKRKVLAPELCANIAQYISDNLNMEYRIKDQMETEEIIRAESENIESIISKDTWIAGNIQEEEKNEIKPIQKTDEPNIFVPLESNENKSVVKDTIPDKPSLDQNKLLSKISTKPTPCKENAFFSERVKLGWTKEQLKKHYKMSEKEYEKAIVCLKK